MSSPIHTALSRFESSAAAKQRELIRGGGRLYKTAAVVLGPLYIYFEYYIYKLCSGIYAEIRSAK